jgi:hypothetical protein
MVTPHRRAERVSTCTGMLAVALSLVLVAGCSWSRLDDDSSSGDMRPVPTVASSGALSAPGGAAAATPDGPSGPMTTEVVGDPRPDPDSGVTLPPLPDVPIVAACTRLGELGAAEEFGTGAAPATTEALGELGCRFVTGSAVAEVHYLSEGTVESDWFRRNAIEPLGDVSGDAVGIAVFSAPGSDGAAGYTIALVSRREGAVIAVRGTADDRAVAVRLANIVEAST